MPQYYRDFGEFHLLIKEGDVVIPHVKNVEPLREEVDHFVECVQNRKKPLTDATNAIAVDEVLEAIKRLLEKSR